LLLCGRNDPTQKEAAAALGIHLGKKIASYAYMGFFACISCNILSDLAETPRIEKDQRVKGGVYHHGCHIGSLYGGKSISEAKRTFYSFPVIWLCMMH
jgi:hypothetical protein